MFATTASAERTFSADDLVENYQRMSLLPSTQVLLNKNIATLFLADENPAKAIVEIEPTSSLSTEKGVANEDTQLSLPNLVAQSRAKYC